LTTRAIEQWTEDWIEREQFTQAIILNLSYGLATSRPYNAEVAIDK
jgi:hypothetical protein